MPEYKEIQILKQVKVQATDGKFAKYNTNFKEDEKYKKTVKPHYSAHRSTVDFVTNVQIVVGIYTVPLLGNTSACSNFSNCLPIHNNY